VVLPLWMVENRRFPLLWPLAYTTAFTTVQAVIISRETLTQTIQLIRLYVLLFEDFAMYYLFISQLKSSYFK